MFKLLIAYSFSFILIVCFANKVNAQTIPVGMVGFDDQLRILQLQNKLSADHSLMARPFFTNQSITTDSIFKLIESNNPYTTVSKKIWKGNARIELLPTHLYAKFNSNLPYSYNQAGFLKAKGLQTSISTGAFFSYGNWLTLQFKPELVYAANPTFPHNAEYGAPTNGTYSRLFLGQSSIRLNKWGLSLGLSNENSWWGPGIHNSLLMSNNAPGFLHLTLNTTRPIKTPIGNFEFQLIGGKLEEDTTVLLENRNLTTTFYDPNSYDGTGNSGPYNAKKSWRYLSGLTLTYNPKWVKGLFLSINRVGYAYHYKIQQNVSGYSFMQRYFPVFFGVLRESYPFGTPTNVSPVGIKQIASISARFLFPKSHAEIYTEYGYGDNFTNIRDWNTDAPHSTAYILGLKKLKKLRNNQWIDFSMEFTRMAESINYLVRTARNWYIYEGGYTNQNRVLGAGIGGGNNTVIGKLQWLKGFSRLGITIQGIQYGPTTIVSNSLPDFGLRQTKWNDFSIGVNGQHRFKKMILSADIQTIRTKNYAWEQGNNQSNLYAFLTATYLW